MSDDRVERRLAAILAGDVVGYSRLMGADEVGTLRALKAIRRELADPCIAAHHGRVVKTTGDGILIEFSSVVDAVACAVAIQDGMVARNASVPEGKRIVFRIGINIGDIIIDEADIHGDGVNVAARLEGMAQPGEICISAAVYEQVRGKLDVAFKDLGERALKNIARPVKVYGVIKGSPTGEASTPTTAERVVLPLPDKPSIAVLPFQNMSGDPEQEYFIDGVVEEIITALSRMRLLFVIARNSTFTYKGRAVDVRQVGRDLGVRYVLEGSVRRAADRLRITAQLVDTASGAHLWADRFDGTVADIFDLQDQVTAKVVGAIAPKLEQVEIERAKRKPTESLDAYDYFLRGMASIHLGTDEANSEALRLFHRAIELDPGFASAFGMAAFCFVWRKTNGWMADRAHETAEAEQLARRAIELGKDDALALCRGGHALAYVARDVEGGAAFIDQALSLNPNLATAWYASGWTRVYLGEPDKAIEQLGRAMRLSPLDPEIVRMEAGIATAHFLSGHYDEAALWARKALREKPTYLTAIRITAASHAMADRPEEAWEAMSQLRQLDPALRLSNLRDRLPFRKPEDLARYADGLRKAGLPE
jgi:adenylate cyclase